MKQLFSFLLPIAVCLAALAHLSPARAEEEAAAEPERPKIDLVVVIDTTSSMSDEIVMLRRFAWDLANGILSVDDPPNLQLGLVRYRDRRDAYVTKVTPLSRDLDAIYVTLKNTRASGGGDTPEHVAAGLARALEQPWREDARKLIVLIGDAGPKDYGDHDWRRLSWKAGKRGIAIHSVGCSGLDAAGRRAFESIAKQSGGTFTALPTGFAHKKEDDHGLRDLILERAGLMALITTAER